LRLHKLSVKDNSENGGQNRQPASDFCQDTLLHIYADDILSQYPCGTASKQLSTPDESHYVTSTFSLFFFRYWVVKRRRGGSAGVDHEKPQQETV
jgi:hypothetical protein